MVAGLDSSLETGSEDELFDKEWLIAGASGCSSREPKREGQCLAPSSSSSSPKSGEVSVLFTQGESKVDVPGVVKLVMVVDGGAERLSSMTSLGEMVCGVVCADTECSLRESKEAA